MLREDLGIEAKLVIALICWIFSLFCHGKESVRWFAHRNEVGDLLLISGRVVVLGIVANPMTQLANVQLGIFNWKPLFDKLFDIVCQLDAAGCQVIDSYGIWNRVSQIFVECLSEWATKHPLTKAHQ